MNSLAAGLEPPRRVKPKMANYRANLSEKITEYWGMMKATPGSRWNKWWSNLCVLRGLSKTILKQSPKKERKKCIPVKASCFPTRNSMMTLMGQCPQAFQEGYKLLAGRHIGEDGEDFSRQVIHALEEQNPIKKKNKKRVTGFSLEKLWTPSLHRYHWLQPVEHWLPAPRWLYQVSFISSSQTTAMCLHAISSSPPPQPSRRVHVI